VEELYYPGDAAAARRRRSIYPKPEGTGRESGSLYSGSLTLETIFRHPDHTVGLRAKTRHRINGVWIGDVTEVRRGFCDIYYVTHDGQQFAHAGGPTGAETYLEERYWLYGDPPGMMAKPPAVNTQEPRESVWKRVLGIFAGAT